MYTNAKGFIKTELKNNFPPQTNTTSEENIDFIINNINYTNQDNVVNKSEPTETTLGDIKYPGVFDTRARVILFLYCCVFLVAVVGNVNAFANLFRSRRRKSRISLLMIHLTIADLIVTFVMLPLEIAWRITMQWLAGNVSCKILMFFRAFGLYLSSNVLICISMDRYFAIVHPLRMSNKRRRGKLMLCGAWVTSTCYAFPQLLIFHVKKHPRFDNYTQCVSFGYFSTHRQEMAYNLSCLIMMYFLPLAIIVYSYSTILWKVWRKSARCPAEERADNRAECNPTTRIGTVSESRSSNTKCTWSTELGTMSDGKTKVRKLRTRIILRRSDMQSIERARIRTLKMTIVIVVAFLICWTPYVIMALWYMLDKMSAKSVPLWLQDGLFMMAVSNSCMNPLVYGRFKLQSVGGIHATSTSGCCIALPCSCAAKYARRRHCKRRRNPEANIRFEE